MHSNLEANSLDSYVMQNESQSCHPDNDDGNTTSRTIIVKRMKLTLNDKECQVLNFIDISSYQRLKDQEEKSKQLSSLNSQVSN